MNKGKKREVSWARQRVVRRQTPESIIYMYATFYEHDISVREKIIDSRRFMWV